MNIAEIQGAANDAYLKTLGSIDLVPSGHYKAIAAAVAAVAPLLLAELTQDEITALAHKLDSDGALPEGWALTVNAVVFSNRLASLTAKPDPAIEAVKALTINWLNMKLTDASAREVVAAVDAARAK